MDLLEIKNYLQNRGINTTIQIGNVIDGNGVGLFSTVGLKPKFYMDNTILCEDGLQIISRNTTYLEGEKVINDIFVLLNSLEGLEPQQSPFYIGRNEKGQAEFSVNYLITKEGAY